MDQKNTERGFDKELEKKTDCLRPNTPELNWSDLSAHKITRRTLLKAMGAVGLGASTASLLVNQSALAQEGSELVAGWNLDALGDMDAAFIDVTEEMQVASNIYSGLVYMDKDLKPQPDLAEDWEVSKDGKTWTFSLRKGVKFHNGDDFTADDVLFTYKRNSDPELGSPMITRLEAIETVEKLDTFTVQFKLKEPMGAFPAVIASRFPGRVMTIVNRQALKKMGREQYAVTPVGTGPFKVTEHTVGQQMVLEKFEDYFVEGLPKIDKITIKFVPEAETQRASLQTGEIQFLNRAPSQFIKQLKRLPKITVAEGPDPGFQSVLINQEGAIPEFKDRRARMALAKAINRDELVKRGYFNQVQADTGPIPFAQGFYFKPDKRAQSPQKFDPDGALKLWKRVFGNRKVKVDLVTSKVRGNDRGALALKPLLEDVLPIEIKIDMVDPSVYFSRQTGGDFTVMLAGSGGDLDPNDSLNDFYMTGERLNTFAFSNPAVDKLLEAQTQTGDLETRRDLVRAAEDLVQTLAASAFTHHLKEFVGLRNDVIDPDSFKAHWVPGILGDLAHVRLK